MGQARIRGTLEQRQAVAVDAKSEQKRLTKWLYDHRPTLTRRDKALMRRAKMWLTISGLDTSNLP